MQAAVHVNNNLTSRDDVQAANHAAADNPHPNYLHKQYGGGLKTQVINNTNAISQANQNLVENQGKDFQQQIDNLQGQINKKMVNDLQSALNETNQRVTDQNYQKMSLALANLNSLVLQLRIDAIVASLAAWNDQLNVVALDATINDIGDLRAADTALGQQVNGLTETEIRALIQSVQTAIDALNTHINAEGNVHNLDIHRSAVQLEEIKGILDGLRNDFLYGFEYIITVLAGIKDAINSDLRNVPDTFPSAPTYKDLGDKGIRQAIASLKIEDRVVDFKVPTDIEVSAQVVGGFQSANVDQKMTKNREVVMGVVVTNSATGVYPYKRGTDYELIFAHTAFAFPDGAFYADTFRLAAANKLTSNAVTRRITLGSGKVNRA
ncbi:putative virion structural protein [Salmonella phage SPFM9]|nr:putative virion structural protein [Salmonella phage SPFM9]